MPTRERYCALRAFTNRNFEHPPTPHPEVIPALGIDSSEKIDHSSYEFHQLHKINLTGPDDQNVMTYVRCSPMEYEGTPATCIQAFSYSRRLQMERVFVLSREAEIIEGVVQNMSKRIANITEDENGFWQLRWRFECTAAFDKGILIVPTNAD